jgi:hypothetical protein
MANLGINTGTLIGGAGQPLQYPFVNGFRPSWASIEFRTALAGGAPSAPNPAFQSIDYKATTERKKTRGTNVKPFGKTRGTADFTCKIKMLLHEWNILAGQLAQLSTTGSAYGTVYFQLQVQYAEANMTIITDTIIGCTLDTAEQSSSDGVEDIMVESELSPLDILRNGLSISDQPLGAPNF